jgi:Zn-finger nucleic acid-binding protein
MKKILCGCENSPAFERCELEEGLSGKRCPDCHAEVLFISEFRQWRERRFPDWEKTAPEPSSESSGEQSSKARTCPTCQRVMMRYRTGSAESFWLDYCPPCELVWLDSGEWKALQRDGLALHLDALLTERWQKRVMAKRAEVAREARLLEQTAKDAEAKRAADAIREARLIERFGQETLDEIRRFKNWMNRQPNGKDILAYLSDPSN